VEMMKEETMTCMTKILAETRQDRELFLESSSVGRFFQGRGGCVYLDSVKRNSAVSSPLFLLSPR